MTGVVRSTAVRRRTAATAPTPAAPTRHADPPANKLTPFERRCILDTLNSDRFVDQAPLEVYAQLLDDGVYLCSVSTMYRVLRENAQVSERRRLARHPAKACPELIATAPRQVYSWDITKLAGPEKGRYYGNAGVFVLMALVSFAVVAWFRTKGKHIDERSWSTLVAPLISALVMSGLVGFALANFDLVAGESDTNSILLIVLAGSFIAGLITAAVMKAKRPADFQRLGGTDR